jgi:hypothetical protein
MGQFSNDLFDDLLLENIWPSILKISPWQDQIALFFSLHLLNKAWKQLVDSSESWSAYNVRLVEYQHIEYFMEQNRKAKYENRGPESYSSDEWMNNFD